MDSKVAQIKQILSKPAEQRSTYELKNLLVPLMADISFFKERKLKTPDLNEVCGGLEYASYPNNSFVLRYGEVGDKFYIILKGKVSVWIPMKVENMRRPMKNFMDNVRNRFNRDNDFFFSKSVIKE